MHVSASIDAAFSLGEEIREGFNWEQFITNRKHMLQYAPDIYFEIAPTVSSLNVHKVPELHQELVNANLIHINHIYLNFLERPHHYNVKNMNAISKQQATKIHLNHLDWMLHNGSGTAIVKQFKDLLNYMG